MRHIIVSILFALLLFIMAGYIALAERFVIWHFWNHFIHIFYPVPLVDYLTCVGILIIPNFLMVSHRIAKLYKTL
jgi:hypothetical protein